MPQIFRFGVYTVYFWSNEGLPQEPVHVHISEGKPSGNATKVWITSDGKALLCNNNSNIPRKALNNMIAMIETNSSRIIAQWYELFGDIRYYC